MSELTLVVCLAAVLSGAALAALGWRGRTVGDAPHCRRCRYNLTGLPDDRCPECGTAVSERTIRRGLKRRRGWPLAVGAICGSIGLAGLALMLIARSRSINVYEYYPTSWLITIADHDDVNAMKELLRRISTGALSTDHRTALAEAALRHNIPESSSRHRTYWSLYLAEMERRGWLSQSNTDLFRAQLIPPRLRVRRRVREGEPVAVALTCLDRGASLLDYRCAARLDERRLDGAVIGTAPLSLFRAGSDGQLLTLATDDEWDWIPAEWYAAPGPPGEHTVAWSFTVFLFPHETAFQPAEAFWSKSFTLEKTFDVLPATAPDPIQMTPDTMVDNVLAALLDGGDMSVLEAEDGSCGLKFGGMLKLPHERNQCTVAMDLFARSSLGDHPAGHLVISSRGATLGPMERFARPPEGEIVLLLRPNVDLVRTTLDTYSIWGGEAALGPFPVRAESEAGPSRETAPIRDAPARNE